MSAEGWDDVLDVETRATIGDNAMEDAHNERERCLGLVRAEIEEGRIRGIPETSGTMIILHRIAAAIAHGG